MCQTCGCAISPGNAHLTVSQEGAHGTVIEVLQDLLAANDRRARAEEMSAEAKIAVADGELARARALLLDAFEIWDARGYVIRAAMVARDLAALGAGECFTAYVADAAERRPQSWLATARA